MEAFAFDACDDACSICLESFTVENPATVTMCNHEYHLQCILEWSQRSRECPICWQSLKFSDPTSQKLLAAVEIEKSARTRRRSSYAPAVYSSPVGDSGFHNVQALSEAGDLYFGESIMHQLASIAPMGPESHFSRNEIRGPDHLGHSHLLVCTPCGSSTENENAGSYASSEDDSPPSVTHPVTDTGSHSSSNMNMGSDTANIRQIHLNSRTVNIQTSPETARNLQQSRSPSFSDSLKSKLSAASSRYKETFSKSSRGLKEKLLAHNNSMKELSKEVKREFTAGFLGIGRMVEHLDLTSKRTGNVSPEGTSGISHNGKHTRKIIVSVSPDMTISSNAAHHSSDTLSPKS